LRPERKVVECGLRLKGAVDRLRALGPEETLRRGYTLVQLPDGKLVRGAGAAKTQKDLVIRFSDGKVPVQVRKV
jgi:exodeoxyribonuclease VII large subunit